MTSATHLSIGEVLVLLQDDFPDVTISKIRFLESQGLLDPERTPSGYRKFSDRDVAKLRWILQQQREHFLPLKVIKERLDAAGGGVPDDAGDSSGRLFGAGTGPDADEEPEAVAAPARGKAATVRSITDEDEREESSVSKRGGDSRGGRKRAARRREPADEQQPVRAVRDEEADDAKGSEPASSDARSGRGGAAPMRDAVAVGEVETPSPMHAALDGGPTDVLLTATELAVASGLTQRQLADLAAFGLLPDASGETPGFDGDHLIVARAAAGFLSHGVEARHLKRWKAAAEAEAGIYEQVVAPTVRGGDRETQSTETLRELVDLGDQLRTALLRRALHGLTR
jgi:DNA-binding transcriptional MerR regulator